jgi:hypothetical protein
MIGLAVIGLLIMASAVAFGVWYILSNTSFKKTTNRYRYVKAKDENGNEITKVVDLEDDKNV